MSHRRTALSTTLAGLVLAGLISTAAPAQADTRLLIGMGDSYSTGAGIPPEGTGAGDCRRSARAYPLIAAAELGFAGQNVACGGAVLADLTSTSRRGSPAQIDGIAGADIVVATIGGNDVGGPNGVLDSSRSAASMTSFAASVQALGPRLVATYTDLSRAAPNAAVYILGYPDIVPATQAALQDCLGARAEGLQADDIHHNVDLLNATVADAAAAAGAVFVDTSSSFAGHEMCTPEAYANPPDDPWPASPGAALHPNELGHLALAAELLAAIGGTPDTAPPARPAPSDPPATTPSPPVLTAQERATARDLAAALLDRLRGLFDRGGLTSAPGRPGAGIHR